jgi:predicted enzyme related to lactoylglutathione lyase
MPNGKICYLEIPTTDVETSANFYTKIFGWNVRLRGDGACAFDDTTGAVSGSWVLDRPPSSEPGILTYIMVDNIDTTLTEITKAGGQVVTPRTSIGSGSEACATFRDPAGNILGLYQGQ